MTLLATLKPSKEFEPLDPGTHLARCDAVVSVGWQKTEYGDKDSLFLRFEVPAERKEFTRDGVEVDEPATIWCQYTNNLHEKAKLRKHLDNWLGSFTEAQLQSGFDLSSLLGKSCIITIKKTQKGDKTYHNVDGVAKVMKGQEVPPQELSSIFFGPEDTDQWEDVPEWLQKKYDARVEPPGLVISVQAEMKADSKPEPEEADFHDDDIPFRPEAA